MTIHPTRIKILNEIGFQIGVIMEYVDPMQMQSNSFIIEIITSNICKTSFCVKNDEIKFPDLFPVSTKQL